VAQPWQTIQSADTPDGVLELRKRGDRDFLILINNRVLMNSSASRSEIVLGEAACGKVASRPRPRVLIGGLGMGLTLRAALDSLPASAQVVVAELNPVIVAWCRGPLAGLTSRAVDDPRVLAEIKDVSALIAASAEKPFDALSSISMKDRIQARMRSMIRFMEPAHCGIRLPLYQGKAFSPSGERLLMGDSRSVWRQRDLRLTVSGRGGAGCAMWCMWRGRQANNMARRAIFSIRAVQ